MSEAVKTAVKPKTAKAPAKAIEKKAEAKPAAKPEAKKTPAGATVKLTQVTGTIARKWDQQATLKGLGLGKRHKTSVIQDSPEVQGMINKVRHLVKVDKA